MEWLSKKVVAGFVNRVFGQYLEDLNTQEVNDALLSGQVNLTNLRIRRDALSFLDVYYGNTLPVEVRKGTIGRVSLTIPYSSFFTQPVVINIEDVFILATPVVEYDEERERDLDRARKRQNLGYLFPDPTPVNDEKDGNSLWGLLYNRIWNNLELHINNVHIRYEDTYSCTQPLVIGFCLQSFSADTTNHKWKKAQVDGNAMTINKVVDFVSASMYINPNCDRQRLVKPHTSSDLWHQYLQQGLKIFSINEEPFQFILQPVRCKVKMRQQLRREARVPGLLVDAVIKDAALTLTHHQYLALTQLSESFMAVNTNRRFLKYRPEVPLTRHAVEWWQYAANAIVKEQIRPYSWPRIKEHRSLYRKYTGLYKKHLLEGHSGELEADLMKLEDSLNITNIVLARMQAKIEISRDEPSLVQSVESSGGESWFSWLWGASDDSVDGPKEVVDVVANKRKGGVLATLTDEEKKQLYAALCQLEAPGDDMQKDDIDHKIYLSLQNVSLTLKDQMHDIALASLSGFVISAENRHGVKYQKVSAKAESFNLEASNIEQELVYIMKLVDRGPSAGYGIAFSVDLERNPLNFASDFAVTMKLDPLEVLYNQYACAEIINFFKVPHVEYRALEEVARDTLTEVVNTGKAAVEYAIARHKTVHLDIDIKSPYIVLPEHGSIQKGGNVLVFDMGGLRVNSEIGGQTVDLEDATRMELEERLYDRLTITVSQLQVLFADSGDEWRVHRTLDDSDSHLLPRVRVKVDLANSIHPEYRQQPRQKVDIHITPLKLNLSDSKLAQLVEFAHHFPMIQAALIIPDSVDSEMITSHRLDLNHCLLDQNLSELKGIRDDLLSRLKTKPMIPDSTDMHLTPPLLRHIRPLSSIDTISQTSLELEKYFSASDNSDDEGDAWRKPVDLPGFEDNTSPKNMITILSRFCIDEIVISISRSNDHGDRPYLMIRATHLVLESAMMDYGPAIQVTLSSVHLVDKYHHSPTGEYLELISSPQVGSIATILYRKVRANCPDFKSHFHSCEQSLVINFTTLNIVWHRGSIITLTNFLTLLSSKLGHVEQQIPKIVIPNSFILWLKSGPEDPPVPSGATKWSFATHLNTLNMKLCDNEVDFLQAKVGGLQGECVFKANEKKVMRVSLSELVVDDMSDITLHSRIIEIEEDRVFDIKLVHFSPTHKGVEDLDASPHTVNPDASLRIRIGRVQCVFLCKFISDLQRFIEPLLNREGTQVAIKHAEKAVESKVEELVSGRKLSLSIDIHAPTLLIPQKSDSPSLLVVHIGDLKIDNMFKMVGSGSAGGGAVENILIELGPMQVCRAVMTLGGGLEMQEDILEPTRIRADIKRSLIPQCRDLLSWDVSVHMGMVSVNLGQRDLNTILAVMTQNRAEAQFTDAGIHSQPLTPVDLGTPLANGDDSVGRLQAFLTHSIDIYRIADALVSLDGLIVTLYTDMDEVLSSPVRDAASALCRLEVGEIEVHGDMNSDRSMDVRLTLHSCDLFDVRPDNNHIIKKIFGQYSSEMQMKFGRFSVSVPPMMDVMYKVSPSGDAAVEISIERTRLNMSVGFALAMYKYVNDAIPNTASTSGGILNPGFVGDLGTSVDGVRIIRRPPSSVDSTSGYLSTVTSNTDDQKTLCISLKVKRPEIVLFADPEETVSRVLVIRLEIHMDYSRHPGNESFHVTLDACHLFATMYTYREQSPYSIMLPCDLEGSWVFRSVEEGMRAEIKVSHVAFHLNPSVVHLLMDVIEELSANLSPQLVPFKLQLPSADLEDLWSPKPLTATISPTHPDEELYIKPVYPSTKPQQRLIIKLPMISISFEKYSLKSAVPVLMMKAAVNAEVNDWSKLMYTKTEIQLQLSCYNEEFSTWEAVIEPVNEEKEPRPWEALIRTLQHPAQPIGIKRTHPGPRHDSVDSCSTNNRNSYISCTIDDSESSTDEEHQDNEMVILKPHAATKVKRSTTRRSAADMGNISGYPLDSDSETEDGLLHKISSAFSHMFSSDSEGSEEGSSDDIEEDLKQDVEEEHYECSDRSITEGQDSQEEDDGAVFEPPRLVPDTVDAPEPDTTTDDTGEMATNVFVDSRDPLEISLTPHIMTAIYNMVCEYLEKPAEPQPITTSAGSALKEMEVINEIGPKSKVTILAQVENNGKTSFEVVTSAKYQEPDSVPSSPASGKSYSRGDSVSEEESCADGMGDLDHLSLNSCPAAVSSRSPTTDIPLLEPGFDQLCPNPVTLYQDITKHRVQISVPGFDDLTVFVGTRSCSRIFQLSPPRNDRRYHVIVTVQVEHHLTRVTVRSPLQVLNDLPLPVNVCFKKSILEMLGDSLGELHTRVVSPVNPFEAHVPMATLQPDQIFTVPITVAYHSSLHIQPAAADYGISEAGIWWKEILSSSRSHLLTCKPKTDYDPDISAALTIQEGIRLSSLQWEGLGGVLPNYILRVSPPLAIYNHLPCTLVLTHPVFAQPLTLDPGAYTTLYKISLDEKVSLEAKVCNYLGSDWDGTLEIGAEKGDNHRTLTLSHGDGDARRKLELALYTVRSGSTAVYVYAPYWIVNKTALPLHIRGSRSKTVYDLNGSEEIVLFRYKRNYPHKLKVRVIESDWSRRWSCEAVGSCGVVVCTDSTRGKKYRLLTRVKQSTLTAQTPFEGVQAGASQGRLHLTKIVTLMPYFLVRNLTARPLKFMQENDKVELWYDINPQQCMVFWPDSENMYMVVRYRDQQVRSQHFHFNSIHSTVLRMEKGRALEVCVSGVGSDHPVVITFDKYQSGDAPVRIENWCEDVHLRLHQRGSNQTHLLAPYQSQLYTWDDPTLPHELLWNTYNRKSDDIPAVIDRDDYGSKCVTVTTLKPGMVRTKSQSSVGTPKTRPKKLSQRQRAKTTASSTDSEEDADSAIEKGQHLFLTPDNCNKSQLTKTRRDKILVHWVSHKQGGQRVLLFTQSDHLAATTRLPMERATLELCLSLEKVGLSLINRSHREVAYMALISEAAKWELEVDGVWKIPPSLELIAWLEDQYLHNKHAKVNLKGSLQVDLTKMYMTRPFSGKLRRNKRPALWFQYRHSQHYTFVSAQLHRIQVDNQLLDAVFPTVLYPYNENGAIQPCLSSCLLLHSAAGQLTTIKHLSLVAQEFCLKLDKGFLLSMYDALEPVLPILNSSNIHTELKKLKTPVTFSAMSNVQANDEGPHVERLCVAGLRVRFSFSPRGTVLGNHNNQNDVLEWFLTSLGATLTEMKNVTISVGHYERQSIPWDKLVVDFMDHAKYQVIQQVYVLVLGLDILGNPYQRLRDLSQGVKDLVYQPALGIIDGPDEFAEGIARGAQSLMGHVVGGTADSLNLISSSVGNVISVLSFDPDYRKKRQQRLHMQSSIPTTLLHAAQTFVMGVVMGVSGVAVKPIAGNRLPGAQKDGVEGFFRGLGRGIMGLITKPALGVIDSVAMACDSIRRAVDLGYDVIARSRVPRHVSPYIALRPYNAHEAAGMSLLASLSHGHYTQTDSYFAHAPLSKFDRPDIILISDKNIFKLERCSVWGGWDISWKVAIRNLLHQPTLKDNTILLVLRQDESHSQLSGSEHQIKSSDSDVLLFLMRCIEVLTTLHMVDQPCPRTP